MFDQSEVNTGGAKKVEEVDKILSHLNDSIAVVGGKDNSKKKPKLPDNYAPFGLRTAARLIDWALLGLVLLFLLFLSSFVLAGRFSLSDLDKITSLCRDAASVQNIEECKYFSQEVEKIYRVVFLIMAFLQTAYYLIPSMSKWQGTLGKKLLGLQILSDTGFKPNRVQILAREAFFLSVNYTFAFSFFLSDFAILTNLLNILIFFSIGQTLWHPKKQAMHDEIAQTIVVKN